MFFDKLSSLVTGLGSTKDKTTGLGYAFTPLQLDQIIYAYRGDWIARKVVDIPAFDMVRAGRDWQADAADIEKLEATEQALWLKPKLAKALKLARLTGGSALIMGIDQGRPDEELRLDALGKDALKYLHVVHRYELTVGEMDRDPMSPYFGEPKHYELSSQGDSVKVHPSRVVRFIGAEIPDLTSVSTDGWGDSVLDVINDAVINAGLTQQGIAHLVQEAKVDVFKIKDLTAKVKSPEYRSQVIERFRLANVGKSMVQALIMDAEEEYEQKTINFGQLPEIARLYLSIAAGAADIPATRFLGQSPDGMNATGESDVRNYYDRISAEQELYLRPQLQRLDEVLIVSALGARKPEVHFTFGPLWQMSEKEAADVFKLKAEAARTIAGTGGASPPLMPIEALSDALVNAFVEDGSLPGLEAAIEEYGKLSEQEEDDAETAAAALAIAAKPPVEVGDAAPRTLYVSRKLVNAAEFIAWAKSQGFAQTLAADDLHVTVTYSRAAVDWMEMGENWSGDGKGNITVAAGGPRLVEKLGDKGAVVLLFTSNDLRWRHDMMVEKGCSWDYPEYQPHVTITYQGADVDLTAVEPYRGKLVFGPELFAELDEDWTSKVAEAA